MQQAIAKSPVEMTRPLRDRDMILIEYRRPAVVSLAIRNLHAASTDRNTRAKAAKSAKIAKRTNNNEFLGVLGSLASLVLAFANDPLKNVSSSCKMP